MTFKEISTPLLTPALPVVHRQLLLTPEAQSFLAGDCSAEVEELAGDIVNALSGRDRNDGAIRVARHGWLLFILNPLEEGGAERVVVWHGPTDGIFFNETILSRTGAAGTNFQ